MFVRMDYFLKSRHVLGETHTPTIRAQEGEREWNISKLRLDAGKLSELILKLQKWMKQQKTTLCPKNEASLASFVILIGILLSWGRFGK